MILDSNIIITAKAQGFILSESAPMVRTPKGEAWNQFNTSLSIFGFSEFVTFLNFENIVSISLSA